MADREGHHCPAVQQGRLTDRKLRREPVHSRRAKIICKSKSERALLAGVPGRRRKAKQGDRKRTEKAEKQRGGRQAAESKKQEARRSEPRPHKGPERGKLLNDVVKNEK